MGAIIPTKRKIKNWQEVLWREQRFCQDKDYAKHLRRILLTRPASWFYGFTLNQQARPYAAEVEAALRTACDTHRGVRYYWQRRLDRLDEAKKTVTPLSKLIANLEDHHWLERFISRQVLLYRGGEVVETLQELARTGLPTKRSIAIWLLLSICEETKERLAKEADNLLCPRCLVHCSPLEIGLPELDTVEYYGCYACHQSSDFQPWPSRGVVAVLDRNEDKEKIQEDDQIRVNWLVRRTLFDFDRVEIIKATDEEVERFAVQVGNDTDKIRDSRYEKMTCLVSSHCFLSENTIRILEYTFSSVERVKLA